MERLKLKCPTCWAETYVPVEGSPEHEQAVIDKVQEQHEQVRPGCAGGGAPNIERRDPMTDIEAENVRKWGDVQDQV